MWASRGAMEVAPIAGAIAFGLVRLVLLERFHVELPSYEGAYVSPRERDEVAGLIAGGVMTDGWHPVTDCPRPGDGVVFRILNRPWHVGVMVSDRDFLHVF